jgi:Vitamin K-dependent gamma-carboxylase
MTAISHRIHNSLFRGVSIAPLVAFRVIFGALMLFGVVRFILKGWVQELYITPQFYFPYLGFEWIKPLPGDWMYIPFLLMVVAAIGILLGFRYRFSAVLFFVCFTYIELIDKSNYLNHYYFVSLVSFLLCWVPANACFSVDAHRNVSIRKHIVPAWTILIIQLQLGMVYFFAGVAKLNTDWLFHAQPLKIWLQAYRDMPYLGSLFASTWLAFAFSWFGCIYDLTIPFFLSFRKTRPYAYFFVIVFHIVTWMLFPIGVFPWVMIFSTLIFFSPKFHMRWINLLKKAFGKNRCEITEIDHKAPKSTRTIAWVIGIYLAIQVLVPLRFMLYPGNLFWNEEGFRFSWRVMLMHKEGYATFYVVDPKTSNSIQIVNSDYLTPTQVDQMATQPDMILQFAHHLGRQFHDTIIQYGTQQVHLKDPKVEAEVFVSLNGRPHQLFISRKTNLLNESYSLKHRTWLETFHDTENF